MTKFDQPLLVELKRSPRLAVISGLVHAMALATSIVMPMQPAWRVTLCVWVLANFVWFVRRHITATSRRAVRTIAWDKQRGWWIADGGGIWRPARPVFPVFVSFPLVVVRFRLSLFKVCSVMIIKDRMSADEFRRLRVRLLQSVRGHRNQSNLPSRDVW